MEHGVKESKELLTGAFAITELLIERFSDGVGVDDAVAIFDKLQNDEEFKAKISEAYEGYEKLGDEIKDIDIEEGFELVAHVMPLVLGLINNIKASKQA